MKEIIEQIIDLIGSKKSKRKQKLAVLKGLIDQFVENREILKKEFQRETNKKAKKELIKEYKAVVKLLHRTKKRYAKMKSL